MAEKTVIYYYSGSGNSLFVAKHIGEKLCKNGNIHLTGDGPVWGHDCQQCMAYIMWCPNRAIRHPNVPEKRRRYQNPNVTLRDMMQSEFHVGES